MNVPGFRAWNSSHRKSNWDRLFTGQKPGFRESTAVNMEIGAKKWTLRLGIFLLLSCPPSQAADSIGMTVVSRGDVEIISAGETNPLGRGDFILEQDEIVVGNRSFAVLQFVDGTKLSLRPDSRLVIEQYQYLGGEDDTATLNLVEGGLRVHLGAISYQEQKPYRIQTPSGLLLVTEQEGALTLCDNEICEQQGLIELKD